MIEGHKHPCAEGIAAAWSPPGPCPDWAKRWVLVATILGSSLAFIVGSVVNVALPAIQMGLGASATEMQWVINAYVLFLGALMLAGGSAGDRLGRRRIFLFGTALFTAASIACGVAPDPGSLILARSIQGVGGAMLVPTSLTIISATFTGKERGRAIGTWAGFSALATAFAPVLGGWLVDVGSWRWVFFLVVPLALVTIAVAAGTMPESRERNPGPLDWQGTLFATVGLGAASYGLIASSEVGWGNPAVILPLVLGGLSLGLFLGTEARASAPMMPLDLFRSRSFAGANAITLLLYFSLAGALFFLPFNLIQIQGYSATAAGAAFLPFTLLIGLLSPWAGGLVERVGARRPLVAGPLLTGIGLALLAVPGVGGPYWTTFFPGMLVVGIGMTISVAPLTTVVMSSVDANRAGIASGVNNAASRIAGLLGVAVLGLVLLALFGRGLEQRLAEVDAPPEAKALVFEARHSLAAAQIPPRLDEATQHALEGAIQDSFVGAFRWTIVIAAILALLSAMAAALTIEKAEEEVDGERVR